MRITVSILLLLLLCGDAFDKAAVSAAEVSSFDSEVAPILAARCASCHNDFDKKGGLDLTRVKAARTGGDSGEPIVDHDAEASLLWQRIESGEMPPEEPLSQAEVATIKQWISTGAKWGTSPIDVFQFFQRSARGQRLVVPATTCVTRTTAESVSRKRPQPDRQLCPCTVKDRCLSPTAEADKRSLIRRVSFDLLGLPPSIQQVETFIADDSDQAYEQLVRQMLNSPHYGERWARHWLDVARYGESDGFEYDRMRPHAWRYRDWVIAALNEDMPYNKFAALQIAGDIISPGDPDAITATGFLVCGAHDGLIPQGDVMKKVMRQDTLEDFVGTISQTFLGMTTNCARCHDHKFDPIKQSEILSPDRCGRRRHAWQSQGDP